MSKIDIIEGNSGSRSNTYFPQRLGRKLQSRLAPPGFFSTHNSRLVTEKISLSALAYFHEMWWRSTKIKQLLGS
ncbi:hypothetical protein QUB05_24890 [Microcoleus sp. F10-C6]|uniref:hypothetical protein n=1 Tax=unclassified Microcoleus TaxID=2642155 RepID=UPI002FD647BE